MLESNRAYVGKTYVPDVGRYTGQKITVLGEDFLFPEKDRFLVRAENGDEWGTDGVGVRFWIDRQKGKQQTRERLKGVGHDEA